LTQARQVSIVAAVNVRGGTPDFLDIHTTPEGLHFFRRIEATADGPDLPCDVQLEAEIEEGAYVVTEVRCSRRSRGPEVTSEGIRAIPVARILHVAALDVNKGVFGPWSDRDTLRAQGPTDESLRVTAQIYRMAHVVRDNPTAAVSSALGLPKPTASRWVQMARKRGFLGPAESRKAGERATRKRRK
jgi:hypothetical protein